MRWISQLLLGSIIVYIGTFGCGSDSDDTAATTTTTTDTEDAITNATGVLTATDAAFGSVSSDEFSLQGTTCENGEPANMERSASGYPALLFECKMTSNSNSPDTIRGSVSILKGMMCALESGAGDIQYSESGTDLVAAAGGSLTLDLSECFSASVIAEVGESLPITAATATLLDSETTGYERRLAMTASIGDEEASYQVDYFSTASKAGFKTTEEGNTPGTGGLTQVMIDFENGTILYNTIDDRGGGGGSDSVYRRNVRVKVEGTLDEDTYEFSEITAIQGIYAQSGSSSDYDSLDDSATFVTLRGTASSGYKGLAYNFNNGSISQLSESCTPSSASCSGNDGFTVDSSSLTFYTTPSGWADYLEVAKSLCDGGDLSFDPTPSEGSVGTCD